MKRNQKLILLISSIFLTSASNLIFAKVIPLPKGIYLGGDIGLTRFYGKTYPSPSTYSSDGKAWGGYVGYKFFKYFSAETGYTRYVDTRILNTNGSITAYDTHYAFDVAGVFTLPLKDTGLEVFGKAGIAWISSQIKKINPTTAAVNNLTFNTNNQSATGFYWGGGIQWYFSQSAAVHIQYAQAQGNSNTGTLGMGSVGLSVLFNT